MSKSHQPSTGKCECHQMEKLERDAAAHLCCTSSAPPPVPLVLNRCRLRHTALVPQFFANRITRLHPRPHYLHLARRRKDCSPRRDHKRLRAPEPERVFHLRAEQQVDCSSFVCLCCPAGCQYVGCKWLRGSSHHRRTARDVAPRPED